MANKNIKMVPNQAGDHPADYYSWGDESKIGIISRKEQFTEQLGEAFDSIEIKEDMQTPELDYVLKVLGKEAGRIIIPFNMVVKDAYYDKDTKEIVIIFRIGEEEKEIRFSVSDLIDIYTGDEVTIHVENNVISITKQVMDTIDSLRTSIDYEKRYRKEGDDKLREQIESETAERKAADEKIEADVEEKTKDVVRWTYSDGSRKHIVMNNHDSIIGKSTDGTTYNLAMVSKWDVADFGSASIHMNLNSKDGIVTINDSRQVATKDEIPSLDGYATEAYVDTKVNEEKAARETADASIEASVSKEVIDRKDADAEIKKEFNGKTDVIQDNLQDLTRAHIESVTALQNADAQLHQEILNLEKDLDTEVERAITSETLLSDNIDGIVITKESDLLYALYVKGEKHGEINIPKNQFLKSVTYDPSTKELVFVFDTEEGEKVQRVSVADLIDVYEAGDGLKLTGNVFSADFSKITSIEALDERTKNMVEWDNDSDRKHLVLNNHDNILGVSTDGTEYNLAMVSKWDVADFGSSSLPMNLNSKDGVVMVNDTKQVITSDDTIPLSDIEALFA